MLQVLSKLAAVNLRVASCEGVRIQAKMSRAVSGRPKPGLQVMNARCSPDSHRELGFLVFTPPPRTKVEKAK